VSGERPAVTYVANLIMLVVLRFPSLREHAEDVVQEVHLRLLRNLREGRFSRRSSFGRYAQRIALYVCVDRVRRRKPTEPIERAISQIRGSGNPRTILDELAREEDIEEMILCLEQLSSLCRDVLRLRFWNEKGHREIAELMGVAVPTSRVRLKRCLETLHAQFLKRKSAKQYPEPNDYINGRGTREMLS
jgi:RNA polymerase sigma factor (sigma-70 family)